MDLDDLAFELLAAEAVRHRGAWHRRCQRHPLTRPISLPP